MPQTVDGVVPDYVRCAYCHGLLNNACLITNCGCRICEHHLVAELFDGGIEKIECPGKTEDCNYIIKGEWIPDKATRRTVLGLKIVCPNHDSDGTACDHTCLFRDLNDHFKICPYSALKCRHCGMEFPRRRLNDHEGTCPQKVIECNFCKKSLFLSQLQNHLDWKSSEACRSHRWDCPYCKKSSLSYEELQQHKDECEKWPQMCEFHLVGCSYMGDDMKAHMKSNVSEHQTLLLKTVLKEKEVLLRENEELRAENVALNKKCSAMRESTEKLKKDFDSRFKKMSHVQRVLANCRERQLDVEKMVEKYGSIDSIIQRLDSRSSVGNLEGNMPQSGSFLWRIENFHARREAADQGQALSILSQPFLTEPYGYKMCCRLYPNGDGSGKGTHLSLFIVIMKSEYDSILRWPFNRRVTFKLMDQSENANHLSETFSPDQRSNSFKRPADEMNVASGCPRFIALTQLESSGSHYLRDDTIFIQVTIEKPPR